MKPRHSLCLALLLPAMATGCIGAGVLRPPETRLEESVAIENEEPATPEEATPAPELDTVIEFRGRTIDLAPHYDAFPYRGFSILGELGKMLYMEEGDAGRTLRVLPLDDVSDLSAGAPVTDIDWTTRNMGSWTALPGQDAVIAVGDEDNQEFFDLYRIGLGDGSIVKLTDVPYIYGFGLDLPRDRVGYVARYPDEARESGFNSCFELLPLGGGDKTTVVCDTDEATFTWSAVRFSIDGNTVWFNTNLANDRARTNLLRLDLTAEQPAVVQVTADTKRAGMYMLREWLDEDRYAFMNDESGFTNLWAGSASTDQVTQLTTFEEELDDGAVLTAADGTVRFLGSVRRPYESELVLVDATGEVLAREVVEANLYSLGHHGDTIWFYATSRHDKVDLIEVTLEGADTFAVSGFFGLPDEEKAKLVHCDTERVQIPTFDIDPATGEKRLLHAYLATPRVPPAEGQPRQVGVVAFYGGGNYFDRTSQIYCEAGIATLSPAVRGSWGFGQEFFGLNDGDLGGDEIVDLHEVGRWLVQERGYEAKHIGVHGGSHGGYATMRALTFPPETNGRDSSFDWGWGISFYGFSDIKTFWETSNIPDWVLLEAGDPETEPDKIRDRSPLHHVDKLQSPILLLHGENDQRVPVRESRQFAAACEAAARDCVYEEFEGQGHGLKGLPNQVRVWRAVLSFMEHAADK